MSAFRMLAAEVGADVQVAKIGGLLHDVGKALTHEVKGPHAEIGAELAKKFGINHNSYLSILEHHDDEHSTIESFIVASADAISASRPGARKESLDQYVKRLSDLENTAIGLAASSAPLRSRAGREVRVMVKPTDIDDIGSAALARDIARKVEENLVFPGQIKVTVIRETVTWKSPARCSSARPAPTRTAAPGNWGAYWQSLTDRPRNRATRSLGLFF